MVPLGSRNGVGSSGKPGSRGWNHRRITQLYGYLCACTLSPDILHPRSSSLGLLATACQPLPEREAHPPNTSALTSPSIPSVVTPAPLSRKLGFLPEEDDSLSTPRPMGLEAPDRAFAVQGDAIGVLRNPKKFVRCARWVSVDRLGWSAAIDPPPPPSPRGSIFKPPDRVKRVRAGIRAAGGSQRGWGGWGWNGPIPLGPTCLQAPNSCAGPDTPDRGPRPDRKTPPPVCTCTARTPNQIQRACAGNSLSTGSTRFGGIAADAHLEFCPECCRGLWGPRHN